MWARCRSRSTRRWRISALRWGRFGSATSPATTSPGTSASGCTSSIPIAYFSRIPDRICELGRFGQKTGAGWYDYKPGDRNAIPSELVTKIILEESAGLGLTRRKVSDQEIVERALYSLINEGARILEEGIALRASDIDVVYIAGYGFPDFRGGPIFYADTIGLPNILRGMRAFAKGYQPDAWQPAPLLAKLAAENRTFASWGNQS